MVTCLSKNLFLDAGKTRDVKDYKDVFASVLEKNINREDDLSSMDWEEGNDIDQYVSNALGYFYSNAEVSPLLQMHHLIIMCSTFCSQYEIRRRTSLIVVPNDCSLNNSRNVCRGREKITQRLNKVHYVLD